MMIFLLIIISLSHSTYASYQYAGCFSQVFYDSFFTSSFMEPTLCFRLCDTPIIYLQKTVCRCSGGGLMHHNRQNDNYCSIPCTKPADREVQTANTCGGSRTYSVYIEERFYTRHSHLLLYQIQFSSCELWKDAQAYNGFSVKFDESTINSSLTKLEKCATACLDQDTTTKSIAFNDDNHQCVCIIPWKYYEINYRSNSTTVLANITCDRYCNNTSTNKFQCGSLTNPRIWAKYDMDGVCPNEYIYIKEIKKCMYRYTNKISSCASPAVNYIYDGKIPWENFLNIIDKLKLKNFLVAIDFAENVVINSSWKCALETTTARPRGFLSNYYPSYTGWYSNEGYMIVNGCLRERSLSTIYLKYLCITNPINKYSISSEDNSTYIQSLDPQIKFCPTNWLDLNGRCYRVSDEQKSIEEARKTCIKISNNDKSYLWSYDNNADDEDVHDLSSGEIVQYSSPWQARLGFFLLDTVPESAATNAESAAETLNLYYEDLTSLVSNNSHHSTINEFQMDSSLIDNNNSTENSCVVSRRIIIDEEERPVLKSIPMNNCSKPRYVLCETKTLIIQDYERGCFHKPLTSDLPALISEQLTHELCLSVCQELQTTLAIIHINKCYCLDGFTTRKFNLTADLKNYQKKSCGLPCLGNRNELCGDNNTIVVFHILASRRTYSEASTPAEPFPDFTYDSCINIDSFDPLTTYQFNLTNRNDVHPRHCLELCTNYQQKYALMDSNQCFCTNIPLKDEEYGNEIYPKHLCSHKCAANYFYTCGGIQNNSVIYSLYTMQPKCRHGYEAAENNQQCVYSHLSIKKKSFSEAQSYCESINGVIAKIHDILEIQDILPESLIKARLLRLFPALYHFKGLAFDEKYFWINRTLDIPDNNTISDRTLTRCAQGSTNTDQNCILIQYEQTTSDNVTLYEPCIIESNKCSSNSAMPVCVDQHVENISAVVSPNVGESQVYTSSDYSCGINTDYDFFGDYCYRFAFYELSWNDAKDECEKDNATLFVPETSATLQIIKSLYLRQNNYASSVFAHVGVIYDNQNRTITTNKNIVPDSNAVYDLCEKTFHERFTSLTNQQNLFKNKQIGCGYIDLLTIITPVIRCDEIPCNRTAIFICQKSPIIKTDIIKAKSVVIEKRSTETDDSTDSLSSDTNSDEYEKSVGRDFAPIFFILVVIFALVFLGIFSTLYNHHLSRKNNNRANNTIYSQLTTANEFNLN